jgi:alkylhydroperoxidase/carboxymuconolactone decarboxylase family protein YurZ
MKEIAEILSPERLEALRATYATPEGKQELDGLLNGTLPSLYKPSGPYVTAVTSIFFTDPKLATDELGQLRDGLSATDRERCIVALLVAQGGRLTLALHIYVALMLGISPNEIAHILLLAGVYVGVEKFTESMFIAVQTLEELETTKATSPRAIYLLLLGKLEPVFAKDLAALNQAGQQAMARGAGR